MIIKTAHKDLHRKEMLMNRFKSRELKFRTWTVLHRISNRYHWDQGFHSIFKNFNNKKTNIILKEQTNNAINFFLTISLKHLPLALI